MLFRSNSSYEDYFYTPEMIEAMGGVENVNHFVECQQKLDRKVHIKHFFRNLLISTIKLVLIFGIIVLLFKIFM